MLAYKDIMEEKIDCVKDLWEKNRLYHKENSNDFSTDYDALSFNERMKVLFNKSKMRKITIVENEEKQVVAYCMSIISETKSSEIATLYVDENYRRAGIGKKLLQLHIKWFEENNIIDVGVEVLHNNFSAISLYENIGLRKDTMKMRIPANKLEFIGEEYEDIRS